MSTRMKGLLKGLRYISQIFAEEMNKQQGQEMQIGFPTDVKHVAHIGWDEAPMDSPSWMKEYNPPEGFQSAPLASTSGKPPETPLVKWVSEDSKSNDREANSSAARSGRRRRSAGNSESSTGKDPSSSRKGTRRSKEKSDKSSHRENKDRPLGDGGGGNDGSESNTGSLPDLPKKTRRKKSKEFNGGSSRTSKSKHGCSTTDTSQLPDESARSGGSSRGSRSKSTDPSITYTSHFSDPGPVTVTAPIPVPGSGTETEPENGSKRSPGKGLPGKESPGKGSPGKESPGKDEFRKITVIKVPIIPGKDEGK